MNHAIGMEAHALRRRLVKGKASDNRSLPETVARWPSWSTAWRKDLADPALRKR
jgi:hypothetical protein